MSALVTNAPVPPGGDGIGLSLTIEHDDDDDDDDKENETNLQPTVDDQRMGTAETMTTPTTATSTTSSFIPISVDLPPMAFQKVASQVADAKKDSAFAAHRMVQAEAEAEAEAEASPSITSVMRQPSTIENDSDEAKSPNEPTQQQQQQQHGPSQVAALEDRVRDLEEKLSTLSMILLQQNHLQSPRSDSSAKSISPPITPFRSIDRLESLDSSNNPVLESPTPVSSRYRNNTNFENSDGFCRISLPYQERRNRNRNEEVKTYKLRNNLSYHILHASNSELDLRSCDDVCDDVCDDDHSGSHGENGKNHAADNDNGKAATNGFGTGTLHTIHNDKEYDNAIRVPSLDSLPGSSRTSPIQSQNPVVNRVLSSEQFIPNQPDKNEFPASANNSDAAGESPKFTFRGTSFDTNSVKKSRSESIGNETTSTVRTGVAGGNTKIGDGTIDTPKHQKKKSNIKSKWLDYLNSVQETNYDTDKQMEEFVKVPSAVEALLGFGFWISVDSFLYTLTMLPIRFAYSILLLMAWVYKKIAGRPAGSFQFHRHNSYHIIQVSIIYLIYGYVLKPINISILYHWIRSQSMVKLYLVVAIVEVFDRLLCSLGQDCLDSLYWNTTRRPRSSRLIVSALVVLIYTALHSSLLFVHVATLNVAMNSDDQALLSLLIGGNFAEIKSTVFKKYNKASLFKIAASDICERFKLALFLMLVLMLNASQGMDQKMLYNYLSMCGIIWCAEWVSDWLKHSFITKFNYIASGVYAEYGLLLAGDVSGFGHEGENLDKSHAVVKRLGLAQIPLVCVMAKYLKEAYKYQTYGNQPQLWVISLGFFSIWLFLLVCKWSLASFLQRLSKMKLEAAPEFSKNNATVAKKKN